MEHQNVAWLAFGDKSFQAIFNVGARGQLVWSGIWVLVNQALQVRWFEAVAVLKQGIH